MITADASSSVEDETVENESKISDELWMSWLLT